jgi:hypothetical protein
MGQNTNCGDFSQLGNQSNVATPRLSVVDVKSWTTKPVLNCWPELPCTEQPWIDASVRDRFSVPVDQVHFDGAGAVEDELHRLGRRLRLHVRIVIELLLGNQRDVVESQLRFPGEHGAETGGGRNLDLGAAIGVGLGGDGVRVVGNGRHLHGRNRLAITIDDLRADCGSGFQRQFDRRGRRLVAGSLPHEEAIALQVAGGVPGHDRLTKNPPQRVLEPERAVGVGPDGHLLQRHFDVGRGLAVLELYDARHVLLGDLRAGGCCQTSDHSGQSQHAAAGPADCGKPTSAMPCGRRCETDHQRCSS